MGHQELLVVVCGGQVVEDSSLEFLEELGEVIFEFLLLGVSGQALKVLQHICYLRAREFLVV